MLLWIGQFSRQKIQRERRRRRERKKEGWKKEKEKEMKKKATNTYRVMYVSFTSSNVDYALQMLLLCSINRSFSHFISFNFISFYTFLFCCVSAGCFCMCATRINVILSSEALNLETMRMNSCVYASLTQGTIVSISKCYAKLFSTTNPNKATKYQKT